MNSGCRKEDRPRSNLRVHSHEIAWRSEDERVGSPRTSVETYSEVEDEGKGSMEEELYKGGLEEGRPLNGNHVEPRLHASEAASNLTLRDPIGRFHLGERSIDVRAHSINANVDRFSSLDSDLGLT